MVLSCLLFFSSCIYIPFNASDTMAISTANDQIWDGMLKKQPNIVAIVCTKKDRNILTSFTNAETLFPEANFVVVFPLTMKKFLNRSVPSEPYLVIIKNHAVSGVIGPIDEESTLLYVIDLYFYGTRPTLNTQTELVAALGEAPITIVSVDAQFGNTFSLMNETSLNIGPANIVSLSISVATELSLRQDQCAIYRKIDQILEPFDCSIKELTEKSRNTFNYATKDNIEKSKKKLVIFYSPKILPSHNEVLYTLGNHFQDFDFFIIKSKSVITYINEVYSTQFSEKTNLGVLDLVNNYIYNVSEFITQEMKEAHKFDTKKWASVTAQLLYQVRNGNVPKLPISEPLPKPTDLPIKKIVGLNFDEFVLEADKDVVVMFVRPNCDECGKVFSEFRRVAEDSKENNNSKLKFAFIDSKKNQIDGGFFPIPKEPSIVLYPAANKTNPRLMIGNRAADVRLLIRLFATHQAKFTKSEKLDDMNYLLTEIEIARSSLKTMTKAQAAVLEDTIAKVSHEIIKNINDVKKSGNEAENSFTTIQNEL